LPRQPGQNRRSGGKSPFPTHLAAAPNISNSVALALAGTLIAAFGSPLTGMLRDPTDPAGGFDKKNRRKPLTFAVGARVARMKNGRNHEAEVERQTAEKYLGSGDHDPKGDRKEKTLSRLLRAPLPCRTGSLAWSGRRHCQKRALQVLSRVPAERPVLERRPTIHRGKRIARPF
jgi:hypothetical protein